jgi:hypothetical protein
LFGALEGFRDELETNRAQASALQAQLDTLNKRAAYLQRQCDELRESVSILNGDIIIPVVQVIDVAPVVDDVADVARDTA